jgi:hypothetical protein
MGRQQTGDPASQRGCINWPIKPSSRSLKACGVAKCCFLVTTSPSGNATRTGALKSRLGPRPGTRQTRRTRRRDRPSAATTLGTTIVPLQRQQEQYDSTHHNKPRSASARSRCNANKEWTDLAISVTEGRIEFRDGIPDSCLENDAIAQLQQNRHMRRTIRQDRRPASAVDGQARSV